MAYAKIALLPVEYGLYSSFVGVVIYVLFATSKDVTIGPVAVMSLQTANVIRAVHDKVGTELYTNPQIASALAFICGVVTLGIGLVRIGWIVEFIPQPAVAGFMTGSAITICAGQAPKLLGLSAVQTSGPAAYEVIINTLKQLPNTTIDAAFGITALVSLYLIRWACNALPRRYPRWARTCFFISVFRNAFVIIVLTAASRIWLGPQNPKRYPISIVKTVPSGFRHIGQPLLSSQLFSDMAGQIPVSVIILLLEHIAISKSFGRLNNYKINPNQELVAIGVTNLIGPAFGGYAATGSFSRSAIKSRSGVRTPLAGWVTAIIVLIALYALSGTFYWIPNAGLAAVIIHAVLDLIVPPSAVYKFWLVSPFEAVIFFGAVLLSIFQNLEVGVYFSVAASLALLLIRIARPRGRWMGIVRISHGDGTVTPRRNSDANVPQREVFVPLDDGNGLRDPSVHVEPPPPGVLIFRFEEAFTYPNASHLGDLLIDRAKQLTRPGATSLYKTNGDRPWNDPGPVNPIFGKVGRSVLCGSARRNAIERHGAKLEAEANAADDPRPLLRAFIFDFSSVANVDTTSIQTLVDVKKSLERYAGQTVEWHFSGILSPWIRRGLLAGGFGTGQANRLVTEIAPVVRATHEDNDGREEEEEADRRANAIDNALQDGRNPAVFRPNRQGLSELEAGLAGDRDATRSHVNVAPREPYTDPFLVDPNAIVPTTVRNTRSSTSSSDDVKLSPHSTGVPHLASQTKHEDDNSSIDGDAESIRSVPVIWNQSLTPFFHLDTSSALAAVTNTRK
jgi:sodium-independent sulfate anion transporter 11